MKAGAGFVSTVGVNALILTVSLFFFAGVTVARL